MATLGDIGLAAAINIVTALAFLLAFAILRLQPINDRVYFPKWYLKGIRDSPRHSGAFVQRFVNLDWRSYLGFLNWMPAAIRMPEPELVEHAGLDSAVYLRIYLLGLKIFVPIALLAWSVLVPVNMTDIGLKLERRSNYTSSDIDKLSISNIQRGSQRFWAHIVMVYAITFWTFYVLYMEYGKVAIMRLQFLASAKRRPDHYTVLVRNIPPDSDESVSELVEHFFLVNHPDHYLTHKVVYDANKLAKLIKKKIKLQNWLVYYQTKLSRNNSNRPTTKTGFLGLLGKKVDAIDHGTSELDKLSKEIADERERVAKDPKSIMPAAFVSFRTRWGAAVCAQTQQTSNPTLWLTEWAPEPRDVYWSNLAIPYVSFTIRKLIVAIAFFSLTFFFMIPIAFVQSLASLEGIQKVAPFLKPLINMKVKSFIQGFLPGIVLKLFLIFLPTIVMIMSKFEGLHSLSSLERRSASKCYIFNFVNVFLGNVVIGAAFDQLNSFIHQSPKKYVTRLFPLFQHASLVKLSCMWLSDFVKCCLQRRSGYVHWQMSSDEQILSGQLSPDSVSHSKSPQTLNQMGVVLSEQSRRAQLGKFRCMLLECGSLQRKKDDEPKFSRVPNGNKESLDGDEPGTWVCVTSGVSYVGNALMHALLDHGYSVRVIIDKPEDIDKLVELEATRDTQTANRNRRVTVAKLTDMPSLLKAFEGCRGVFHTTAFTDPAGLSGYTKHMADMEVKATENVMNACASTPSVRKCVITSSLAACVWGQMTENELNQMVDHNSWSNESLCTQRKLWYALGKLKAEKAAWRIAKDRGLKLTCICPGLVTGLQYNIRNATPTIAYLKGAHEMYGYGVLASVNVMQLAEAHVCVFKEMNRNAYGRYICFDKIIGDHQEAEKLAMEIGMPIDKICGHEQSHSMRRLKLSNDKLSRLMTSSIRCNTD